jgi:hypothetical protein
MWGWPQASGKARPPRVSRPPAHGRPPAACPPARYTDKKKIKFFLIYKEIQSGAVAKSFLRKGFLIYEEMRKYFSIYEETVSHL